MTLPLSQRRNTKPRPALLALTLALAGLGCGHPVPEASAATAADQSQLFGLDKVGILEPDSHWERYRRSEYPPDKSFFQWWFFTVRDAEAGRYFTFTYAMLDAVLDPTARTARTMFTMTDRQAGTKFRKSETFPLARLQVHNDFDVSIFGDAAATVPAYGITVLKDGDYRIRGEMVAPSSSVETDGTLLGQPVDPGVLVKWDLRIHRIAGWYGQNAIEGVARATGTIGWNTYAHESWVEGTLQVGDSLMTVSNAPRWRAYCDMNWGNEFPRGQPGEDPLKYSWGWYYVTLPSMNLGDEVSIISGTGTQHLTDIETGSFADVRLGQKGGFQFVGAEMLKPSVEQAGIKVYDSSDSVGTAYDVVRDDWTPYTDAHGTAMIPLHQKVTVQTLRYTATLDFFSQLEEYNRLPFASERYVYSDFEALGVDVHAVVTHRPYPFSSPEVVADFWTNTGGLEFGYQADFMPTVH